MDDMEIPVGEIARPKAGNHQQRDCQRCQEYGGNP